MDKPAADFSECNGGSVNDSESPINGGSIPRLNSTGRFLRGDTTSGTTQGDAMQGHVHVLNSSDSITLLKNSHPSGTHELFGSAQGDNCGSCSSAYYDEFRKVSPTIGGPSSDGSNGNPRTANETRPGNISVFWIMRIK